ncbi:hypothetical protein COCMIDRAFT_103971, partial [Bipolaris oryzae ATCC 44560]
TRYVKAQNDEALRPQQAIDLIRYTDKLSVRCLVPNSGFIYKLALNVVKKNYLLLS